MLYFLFAKLEYLKIEIIFQGKITSLHVHTLNSHIKVDVNFCKIILKPLINLNLKTTVFNFI